MGQYTKTEKMKTNHNHLFTLYRFSFILLTSFTLIFFIHWRESENKEGSLRRLENILVIL